MKGPDPYAHYIEALQKTYLPFDTSETSLAWDASTLSQDDLDQQTTHNHNASLRASTASTSSTLVRAPSSSRVASINDYVPRKPLIRDRSRQLLRTQRNVPHMKREFDSDFDGNESEDAYEEEDAVQLVQQQQSESSGSELDSEGECTAEQEMLHQDSVFRTDDALSYKWFFNTPMIQITNLESIRHVLRDNSTIYERIWGYGPRVLQAGGQLKRFLRVYSDALSSDESLIDIFPVINQDCHSFVNNLIKNQSGESLSSQKVIKDFYLSLIAKVLLGDSEESHQCIKAHYFTYYKGPVDLLYRVVPFLTSLPTKYGKKYQKMERRKGFFKMLAMKAYYNAKNKVEYEGPLDVLKLVSRSSIEDIEGITLDEILSSSFLVNPASVIAPICSILNIMYTAIRLPEIQTKIREEVKEVMNGRSLDQLAVEDIDKMEYLDLALREIMRLFPPFSDIIPRQSNTADRILGYRVPKGSFVSCPFIKPLRNPQVFLEPDKFIPDRYHHETREARLVSEIPFGFGTRKCLAKRLSKLILKTFMIHMFSQMTIQGDNMDSVKIEIKPQTWIVPEPPIIFKAHPISKATRAEQ
ncbi:hypothetical protein SAMD00019534_101500 [Acytostelium subglobosum LB1]|uniref:hypothetical protein n=1 Tax=Acytostelium subglobosum LB1 TaxID=1410327 RepID=UPI000644FD09|nr:hypothetical protein SAMD00019534_101500 [Acytostelium subglobosum LB1]GAM26975.1 hypothetical protein SAMD00019534_101500 [Acytostelium subglobosum LB1]|eukprot:XP_012750243.1 hypothetical protein SAMD00019534_101500 [Acytostelium subglobosum LB1]